MKRFILIPLFTLFALFSSCSTTAEQTCTGTVMALENMSDLDGCEWILIDEGGMRYEPQNLSEHVSNPANGTRYCVRYDELPDAMSICMVGKIIHLDSMVPTK